MLPARRLGHRKIGRASGRERGWPEAGAAATRRRGTGRGQRFIDHDLLGRQPRRDELQHLPRHFVWTRRQYAHREYEQHHVQGRQPESAAGVLLSTQRGECCRRGGSGTGRSEERRVGRGGGQRRVPPPPGDVELVAGSDSSITIFWDASPGATSYNIYRATSSGLEGSTPIANTSNTMYKDANLSPQPVYFYQLSAVNVAGESARTPEDRKSVG